MQPKNSAKMRRCAQCGADIGMIEDCHYERGDTCGSRECDRDARNDALAEREEAHERLDRDMGWE